MAYTVSMSPAENTEARLDGQDLVDGLIHAAIRRPGRPVMFNMDKCAPEVLPYALAELLRVGARGESSTLDDGAVYAGERYGIRWVVYTVRNLNWEE